MSDLGWTRPYWRQMRAAREYLAARWPATLANNIAAAVRR